MIPILKNYSISVIIPVYNSAEILPELIDKLRAQLPLIAEDYEIILVNDGSRDSSWEAICQLSANYPELSGYNLMRNYGQHNAVLCGIRAASKNVIVTIDDDLQHPPEEIPKLLNKIDEGYDVVYGKPHKEQHGFLRDMASRITKMALQPSMSEEVARNVSAFRAFRTCLRNAFTDYRSSFVSVDVLLTWATTSFIAIPVAHEPRKYGTSNYTLRKLVNHAFNMMTGFSVIPLQLASLLGFLCAIFGVLVLAYVVIQYLILGYSVPGFPFLASIISIFSGVQLLSIGIIGEYLARMHFRIMDKPLYVIRSATKGNLFNA
jgi:undecaprenyl-phosphate 4-deoxy-4-formamido-L-arabinose transferase